MLVSFGTDGIRGTANDSLTAGIALAAGEVYGEYLRKTFSHLASKPNFLIGNDSRISGLLLQNAFVAGLLSQGIEVYLAGVVTTPQLAFLVKHNEFAAGGMITASHNPMPDNGIKLFGRGGLKLSDQLELELAEKINFRLNSPSSNRVEAGLIGDQIGRQIDFTAANQQYLKYLGDIFAGINLTNFKIVVDCANGAASTVAPAFYTSLGAKVISIHDKPNGININDQCGATHVQDLQKQVVKLGANLGIAHDGDADRCIAVDELGNVVDGDILMGMLATEFKENNELNHNAIVVTIMSNLGLINDLNRQGIAVEVCGVGDRQVSKLMRERNINFGGEQSGHIIFSDLATMGDGILTAGMLIKYLADKQANLSQLAGKFNLYPQVLVNVKVADKAKAMENPTTIQAISEIEKSLGTAGRVLVRASGTENLIRVMVEAAEQTVAEDYAEKITKTIVST